MANLLLACLVAMRPKTVRDGALFAFVLIAAMVARTYEVALQVWFMRPRSDVLSALAEFANVCGGGFAVTGFGLVAFGLGRALRKPALSRMALALGVGGLWCWIATCVGQFVFSEARPIDGGGTAFFVWGGHGVSGHASAAALLFFPIRDLLARRGTSRALTTIALVLWIALVAWSRVWLGMHYAWNVVLGLALGFWTGRAAVSVVEHP